jgi:hypothetical protein
MKITRKWFTEKTKVMPNKFTNEFMKDVTLILTKAKELGVDIMPLAKTNRVEDCIIDELLLFTPNKNSTFILLPNDANGSYETEDEESDAVIAAILTLALKHGVITGLTSDIDYVSAMSTELLTTLD